MKIVLRGGGKKIVLRQTGRRGPAGAGLPTGGTTGQVPVKQSAADYDIAWETPPAAPVDSVNGQTGAVVLDATDVGADAAGSAAQALSDANDYTDSAVAGVDTGVMSVVAGNNVTVDNTDPANPVINAADAPAAPVTSVNGRTGAVTGLAEQSSLTAHVNDTDNPHEVTASQVGLGNVNNTSDADKPISTATQTALNGKVSTTGNETIAGIKTFSSSPVVPNGTSAGDAVNLSQLNSRVMQGVGFPNGAVAASVGTIYVDTAVTNGASSWIKKSGAGNTGWVVLEGDTGWRNITSMYSSYITVSNPNDYGFFVRRVGNLVHFNIKAQGVTAGWNGESASLPDGFVIRQSAILPAALNEALQTGGTGRGQIQINNVLIFVSSSWTNSGVRFAFNSMLSTEVAWPTTLPGTPA